MVFFGEKGVQNVILKCDPQTGKCEFNNSSVPKLDWFKKYGKPTPGAPSLFVDNKYYSFFHSTAHTRSPVGDHSIKPFFYLGARTFQNQILPNGSLTFASQKSLELPLYSDEIYDFEYMRGGGRMNVYGTAFDPTNENFIISLGQYNKVSKLMIISKKTIDDNLK